jgi:hypothetical protein
MPPAAGVDSPGKVFAYLSMDLQEVGDVIALRPMVMDRAIRRMVKVKVFHEVPPVLAAKFPRHRIPLTAVRETRHTPSNVS